MRNLALTLLLLAPNVAAAQPIEPSIAEPPGLNRVLWEQLIFNTFDWPSPPNLPALEERTTEMLTHQVVQSIGVCMPASNDGGSELLELFANAEWWEYIVDYWTGLAWSGEFQLGGCSGTPPFGWVHVRGEPIDGSIAGTASTHRTDDGRLESAVIIMATDREFYREGDVDSVEVVLAHEFGHVLGLNHVERGHGYIMRGEYFWPAEEQMMTRLAYRVGPNVLYPGVVYATNVPALPFLDSFVEWLLSR